MIKSLKFPDIFSTTSVNTISGKGATAQNLILTLQAQKSSLFGDPYFGSNLKRMIFEQNNIILRDIVIDDIYTTISTFLPNVRVERKNIEINLSEGTLYANIKLKNLIDFNMEEVSIALFNIEELE